MRRLLSFTIFLLSFIATYAQVNHYEGYKGAVKTGLSYVHDFPGVKGAALYVEAVVPINHWLQGSIGVKRIQTGGTPRTTSITEFTRATTIDLNVFVIPFSNETANFKLGLGCTSSMYHVQRAAALYDKNAPQGLHSDPIWQKTNFSGRSNGMTLTGEYEYFFSSNISLGARIQYTKGYQYVICGGPFAAFRL
jgi:hypothetical protein